MKIVSIGLWIDLMLRLRNTVTEKKKKIETTKKNANAQETRFIRKHNNCTYIDTRIRLYNHVYGNSIVLNAREFRALCK